MPHVDAKPQYQVILTSAEFRLVTLGLAGMLEDIEDIDEALELNVRLCKQRVDSLDDAASVAEKALEGAEKKANPNVPPTKR